MEAPLNNLALAAAAGGVAFLSLVMHRSLNLRETFKAAFPVMALLLVALPFIGSVYSHMFCSGLIFINGIVNISTLFLLVETSRMRQAPIVAVMSATTLIARLCLVASLVAGMMLGAQTHIDYFTRMLIVVIGATYLLGTAFMAISRKTRRSIRTAIPSLDGSADENPEPRADPDPAANPPLPTEEQRMEHRARELADTYHLTHRECEIVLLLARGRTSPYIAAELNITPNTVRSYMREIYTKLGAHSKQDIIDLFS